MIFGKEKNKGVVLDGLRLKVVTIGEDGYTLDDVLRLSRSRSRRSVLRSPVSVSLKMS